ncbi:unnamed protein product, partial [Dicrocoelium dendriticum]
MTLFPIGTAPDSQLPSKSDAATNPSAVDGNLVPTTGRSPPALDHSVFYRRGLELVDVWRDFELAV